MDTHQAEDGMMRAWRGRREPALHPHFKSVPRQDAHAARAAVHLGRGAHGARASRLTKSSWPRWVSPMAVHRSILEPSRMIRRGWCSTAV